MHVSVTMSVRDPLHGLGRCFAERDCSAYALHQKELLAFPELLALFLLFLPLLFLVFYALFFVLPLFLPLLDPVLNAPEEKARQRRGYAGGYNDRCYVHVFTS